MKLEFIYIQIYAIIKGNMLGIFKLCKLKCIVGKLWTKVNVIIRVHLLMSEIYVKDKCLCSSF